jgi:hypothetical protein
MGEAGKTYWLDSFTGTTWREFLDAGGEITGFRASRRKIAGSIKPGDVFLCYLTGVKRWVGALEVIEPTDAGGQIWSFEAFPVRFRVKPLVLLTPETGVPMEQLEGKVWFFTKPEDAPGYKAFVRSSPNRFKKPADGALLMDLLKAAEANPVKRKVSQAALNRKPYFRAETQIGKKTVSTVVSVPDAGDEAAGDTEADETKTPSDHLRLQANLLAIGAEMGLDVWVARNDRGRVYEGQPLGEFENMLDDLPTQFNEATQATIELIDVLWLKGNSIVDIKLYIVAPDDRRDKVDREIKRPTFMLRPKPLNTVCGFLPFSTLMEKVEGIRKLGIAGSLSPGFLEKTAEYFNIAE